jgi:hypothetical protein
MLIALLLAAAFVPQGAGMPAAPSARTLTSWMSAIEPDDVESAFRSIPWRNDLAPAMAEAKALGRPILLWTMNGHPLGCT